MRLKQISGVTTESNTETHVNENLRKWFKDKWVRFGPDGKIRGACARGDDSEGKPKCLPQSQAHSLGKKGRASAAARKRRQDPNPERHGPAINVATKKKSNEDLNEMYQYDESNLMYRYDTATGKLMKAMVHNRDERAALQKGYRDSIEQALRVHNIIRSKFDPQKFVQKQGSKWVEVFPFGQTNKPIKEFQQGSGGGSNNYFKVLASAWYNGIYTTRSLGKGIKSQRDVEKILERGIVCPDGVTRQFNIDYNSDFDGVVIFSEDYFQYGDFGPNGQTVDSRTGKPWGPYDVMEFDEADLTDIDEGLQEVSKKTLANYVKKSHDDIVNRATADSFQSGAAGHQYNKADPSDKELRRKKNLIKALDKLSYLGELSPKTLARYKKAAGIDATAADKKGDFSRGNKRFSGIIKATKKEFDNQANSRKNNKAKQKFEEDSGFSTFMQQLQTANIEKPVDIVVYGKMPAHMRAEDVWDALMEILPNEYPSINDAQEKTQEISQHGGAIVAQRPLNQAKKIVKQFQTYGIKANIQTSESANEGQENVEEAGPFRSTEPKKPRKGSVADLAARKRAEQDRTPQRQREIDAIGNKNHYVGTARVRHDKSDVSEGSDLPPHVIEMIKKIAQSSASPEHKKAAIDALVAKYSKQGVAEGLQQTLRKVVPGYAKREIDKKMDAGKFGKTDADKDANFQRYKKIQDKLKEQGVAEATGDKKFDAMMGSIKTSTPVPVSGYVAVTYASESQSNQIKGVTYNGKPMPTSIDDPGELSGRIEFTPDRIEQHLIEIGQDNGWDMIDPGHGRGYSELFFDTNANYTSNTQSLLAKNIVNTVTQINNFFNNINNSLQSIGLPGYRVDVWQEIASSTGQKIGDLNQIKKIAVSKIVQAPNDAGEQIGKVILRELPKWEADSELGYTPEDFAWARKVAKIYITKGERAGLKAQAYTRARMSHVSDMIDELLGDAGATKLRTIRDLDEQVVAESGYPSPHDYDSDIDYQNAVDRYLRKKGPRPGDEDYELYAPADPLPTRKKQDKNPSLDENYGNKLKQKYIKAILAADKTKELNYLEMATLPELRKIWKSIKPKQTTEDRVLADPLRSKGITPGVGKLVADWFWTEMDLGQSLAKQDAEYHQQLEQSKTALENDLRQLGYSVDFSSDMDYILLKDVNGKITKLPVEDAYSVSGWATQLESVVESRCPQCDGIAYAEKNLAEAKDACYHKVRSRYKVWPSAYASGALVQCRKKGAKNWGNKSK